MDRAVLVMDEALGNTMRRFEEAISVSYEKMA